MKLYAYFVTHCVYLELQETIDEYAKEFWRLHTMTATAGGNYALVFEKELPNPNIFYGSPLSALTMEELAKRDKP